MSEAYAGKSNQQIIDEQVCIHFGTSVNPPTVTG